MRLLFSPTNFGVDRLGEYCCSRSRLAGGIRTDQAGWQPCAPSNNTPGSSPTCWSRPRRIDTAAWTQADGLVLAEDLVAPIDLPPFANSAMDGYAVRAADVQTCPSPCRSSQDIPAGRTDTEPLQPGTAARIMTGAPLPPGADVIVQVERTDGGAGTVRIDSAPAARRARPDAAARTSGPARSCCRPAP